MSDIDDRVTQALDLHAVGRTQDAIALLREISQAEPEHRRCRGTLACVLSDAGSLDEAFHMFQELARTDPSDEYTQVNLAIVLRRMDRLSEAVSFYKQARVLAPERVEFWMEEIRALLDCDLQEEARQRLAEMPAGCCPTATQWRHLGVFFGKASDFVSSRTCQTHALELNPEYAEALADLSGSFEAMGLLDEAETSALRALSINPIDAIAMCSLGRVEERRSRPEAALLWYDRASTADPDYERAKTEADRVRRDMKSRSKGRRWFRRSDRN